VFESINVFLIIKRSFGSFKVWIIYDFFSIKGSEGSFKEIHAHFLLILKEPEGSLKVKGCINYFFLILKGSVDPSTFFLIPKGTKGPVTDVMIFKNIFAEKFSGKRRF
jgi:hypothetical protein